MDVENVGRVAVPSFCGSADYYISLPLDIEIEKDYTLSQN